MTLRALPSNRRPAAGPVSSMLANRELIWQLGFREILGKYKGSFFGVFWSLVNPLLMLAIYTFVFTKVFKSRWIEGETTAEFAIALFVGLIVHGFFAECLARAPGLVVGNPSYVTKIVFPLEILPFPSAMAALFHAGASICILLLAQWAVVGTVPWSAWLFPLVLAPLAVQAIAFSWVLAAFAVYVRDVAQTVSIMTTALLFMSPVFFPLNSLPSYLQGAARWNPLTIPIEQSRKVLLWGQLPDWDQLAIYTLASLAVAWIGFALFQKSRRGFADVL